MSRIEKLMQRFGEKPESVHYRDLRTILLHLGFEEVPTKGSHVKYKHPVLEHDIIIPVHHNECKPFYKRQAREQVRTLLTL